MMGSWIFLEEGQAECGDLKVNEEEVNFGRVSVLTFKLFLKFDLCILILQNIIPKFAS